MSSSYLLTDPQNLQVLSLYQLHILVFLLAHRKAMIIDNRVMIVLNRITMLEVVEELISY